MSENQNHQSSSGDKTGPFSPQRRELLGKILLGGGALAAGGMLVSNEDHVLTNHLGAAENVPATGKEAEKPVCSGEPDAVSGASRVHTNWAKLSDLKGKVPTTKLGNFKCSRMILGGNLVSGFAHARDLIYVSDLVKAYHTKEKIFATFKMAEACGIDTFLMNPSLCEVIKEYWEKAGGAMQFMTNCSGKTPDQIMDNLKRTVDFGGVSCLIQGEVTDRLVREGDFDTINRGIEFVRKNDLPVGVAAHRLESLKACVEKGIKPDYWMKTFHHLNYWSAQTGQKEHDNVFCREPEETAAFMNDQPEPWIAFKVLAAGSIKPRDGFRYAFENGADFICVGMYDFQIVDDVNTCLDVLASIKERKRPWRA